MTKSACEERILSHKIYDKIISTPFGGLLMGTLLDLKKNLPSTRKRKHLKEGTAKVTHSTRTTEVDTETGKVIREVHEQTVRLPKEPDFIKLYLNDIGKILELPKAPTKLLIALADGMKYNGHIMISALGRKELARELGITDGTFRNYMSLLVQKGLLIRRGNNDYLVNPNYLAKGSWADIHERRAELTLSITYGDDGRQIETSAKPKKPEEQQDLPFEG
jgi:hypothetical protein